MTRAEKQLERMRANPRDWRIEDLKTVAIRFGMKVHEGKGSHTVFSHPLLDTALSVPAKRPIKPVYVKQFIELIDEISESP